MYCNKCNYTSFDHLPTCPRCGYEWDDDREKLNLKWVGYNETTWITWEENSFSEKRRQEKKISFTLQDDLPVHSPSLDKSTRNERVHPADIAKSRAESQDEPDDVEIDFEFSLDETNFASPGEINQELANNEHNLSNVSEAAQNSRAKTTHPPSESVQDNQAAKSGEIDTSAEIEKIEEEVIEISFENADFFQKENNVVITNKTKTSSDKAPKKAALPRQNSINDISFPELELLEEEEGKKHD